jgi:hypothetical protein
MRGQVIDGIVTRIDNDYFLIQSGPLEAMVSYEVRIFSLLKVLQRIKDDYFYDQQ